MRTHLDIELLTGKFDWKQHKPLFKLLEWPPCDDWPTLNYEDWLLLNREDWASRLLDDMLATIDSNIQGYETNTEREQLVNALKANNNYWHFVCTLTDKTRCQECEKFE